MNNDNKFILVTSALPYVNNVLHIGNIAGSLLPADIYYRYNVVMKKRSIFISGADENGTPTEVEAYEKKKTPEEVVNHYYNIQLKILKWFNIKPNNYSETSKSEIHKKVVQELFLKAFLNGYIIEKEEENPYDPQLNMFLADRYIIGKCPYCGYEKARGDQCENCGRLLDPKELINPRSILSNSPIIFKKTKHFYLDLSKLENKVNEYIESKKDTFPELSYTTAKGWIKEGLKPRSITRDIKFGIKVPYKELWEIVKDKIIYKLNFSSKDNLKYSLFEALKSLNLAVNNEDFTKISIIVEQYWPRIDQILNNYNYFEQYKDKVFYVWFDALIGYISFTIEKFKEEFKIEELNNIDISDIKEENGRIIINDKKYIVSYELNNDYIELKDLYPIDDNFEKIIKYLLIKNNKNLLKNDLNWKKFWGEEGKVYHFLGKDNIPFHTVFWPAMLMSINDLNKEDYEKYKQYFEITKDFKFNLPYTVIGLSYLLFDGRKISKSQGWGIFCDALSDTNLDSDYFRFYLAYILPINKDSDFKLLEFKEVINKELNDNVGNLLHRVFTFAIKNYNGILDGDIIKEYLDKGKEYYYDIINLYEKGEISLALKKILELSQYCNQIFQNNKPWENPLNSKPLIKTEALLIYLIFKLLYPIIPKHSKQVFNYIKIDNIDKLEDIFNKDVNIKIEGYSKPIFNKIDDNTLNYILQNTSKPKYELK